MKNVDDNFKNEILTQIINHFVEERELLTQSVKGIEEFTSTYSELKTFLDDFKGNTNISVSDNLSTIGNELNLINTTVNNYNENLSDKYKTLQEDFGKLLKKYESLTTSQDKLTNFIGKIDKFMQVLTNFDLNKIITNLNESQTKVESLIDLVETDLKNQIETNNTQIKNAINSFNLFIETSKNQQTAVEEIAQETKATNALLQKMSKSNNINEAVLFELMDKWSEERKRSKK